MKITGFRDLYLAELEEAVSFERLQVEALGAISEKASDDRLKRAFREHRNATARHVESIEALLRKHQADPRAHEDQSVQRLVGESEKMASLVEAGPLRDAALIASLQRIEHYEIAVYGTLIAYATVLGFDDDRQILSGILEQEKDADDLLSDIAVGVINPAVVQMEAAR